jgi:uncharacterized protein (TIGR02145 family)
MSNSLSGTQGCDLYGRLYDWNTATTVCPSGWHLPSDAEWTVLAEAVGGESTAGTKLKATSGWEERDQGSNDTDDYGFSALPGGCWNTTLYNAGRYGFWWSSTEFISSYESISSKAYYSKMDHDHDFLDQYYGDKDIAYSVRCVKDNKTTTPTTHPQPRVFVPYGTHHGRMFIANKIHAYGILFALTGVPVGTLKKSLCSHA